MLLPTPSLAHVDRSEYEFVYEPAEDSFVMLDALQLDLASLLATRPRVVVEVGSGSGIVITALAKALGPDLLYLCTDINAKAAAMSSRTASVNGVCVVPVVTDLMTGLSERLAAQVDVLIFNPPYVVTPDEEIGDTSLFAAWAGGAAGRRVMDRLFPIVPTLLSAAGKFYLLIIEENGEDEIQCIMASLGFQMEVVLRRRCRGEKQSVLCFSRHKNTSTTDGGQPWTSAELNCELWNVGNKYHNAES